MERIFKTLGNHKVIDLVSYIKNYVKEFPETEMIIACDSQNRKRNTIYAIVIGLYRPGKGAHVLYTRFEVTREKDNSKRLMDEVWFSIELAEFIKDNLNIKTKFIDLDLNPDVKYRSNEVISQAVGWVEGMGYKARHKGLFPMLSYAADNLVK